MTSDPEMIGLLQVWLDDVQPLPHSAIDRALAQVPRVVQRRHVWALDRHGGSRLVTAAVLLGVAIALTVGALLRVPTGTQVGGGPAGFVPTGSMLQAREMVTATTLQDGRVLAVGGWEYQDQATVELWDPKTGTFSVAGNMPEPREGQSATLLPSGRVLVVGGYKYKVDRLATALLWDPDTLTFSPAGSLAVPRVGHAAVLLPDGRVLIAGGGLPTAEIWDPVAQAFSDAGASSHAGTESGQAQTGWSGPDRGRQADGSIRATHTSYPQSSGTHGPCRSVRSGRSHDLRAGTATPPSRWSCPGRGWLLQLRSTGRVRRALGA